MMTPFVKNKGALIMNNGTYMKGTTFTIALAVYIVILALSLVTYNKCSKQVEGIEYALMKEKRASKTIEDTEELEQMLLRLKDMYEEHRARYLENRYLDSLEAMAIEEEERKLSNKIATTYNEIFNNKSYLFFGETPDEVPESLEIVK